MPSIFADVAPFLSPALCEALCDQARHAYPSECCGFWASTASGQQLLPLPNQLPQHQKYTSFFADPLAVFEAYDAQDRGLLRLEGIYHSHPDASPCLSEADWAGLRDRGHLTFPGLHALVIGVKRAQNIDARLYLHDAGYERFVSFRL